MPHYKSNHFCTIRNYVYEIGVAIRNYLGLKVGAQSESLRGPGIGKDRYKKLVKTLNLIRSWFVQGSLMNLRMT